MGQPISEEIQPNSNENFLKMFAFPADNLLIATANIHSSSQLSDWASMLLKLSSIKSSPLLLPQQFKIISKYPCGEQSTLEIKYDCFYISFSDEIARRTEEQKHFQEDELWYLLLSLVEAAQIGYNFGSNLGDIKPSNLLLNKQGQIKLLTKFSVPNFSQSFRQQNPDSSLYSPEELESRKRSYKVNKNNYIISESFSIGLTMLAAGALSKVSSLYDYNSNELKMIDFYKLMKYWEQFEFYSESHKATMRYSKQMKDMVLNLLRVEPEKRYSSLQVNKILQNYKKQILSLQKFTIDEIYFENMKLNSQVKAKTHNLKSRRVSQIKQSLKNSVIMPSFNNSHQISFQAPIANTPSQFYDLSDKKLASRVSSSSNKKKLSVTAYFQQKLEEK